MKAIGFCLCLLMMLSNIGVCGDKKSMSEIKKIKAQYEEQLMTMDGVVSVGIGKDLCGDPAVIVGLDKQRPETTTQIHSLLEGHPVVVQVLGTIKPQ